MAHSHSIFVEVEGTPRWQNVMLLSSAVSLSGSVIKTLKGFRMAHLNITLTETYQIH